MGERGEDMQPRARIEPWSLDLNGCQTKWDDIRCWRGAQVGQVVRVSCANVSQLFANNEDTSQPHINFRTRSHSVQHLLSTSVGTGTPPISRDPGDRFSRSFRRLRSPSLHLT
ncbi:unnamed protein product [Boreogadus saida]